jgi:hypothetical protein
MENKRLNIYWEARVIRLSMLFTWPSTLENVPGLHGVQFHAPGSTTPITSEINHTTVAWQSQITSIRISISNQSP